MFQATGEGKLMREFMIIVIGRLEEKRHGCVKRVVFVVLFLVKRSEGKCLILLAYVKGRRAEEESF